jgi:competence protein CoiA
MGLGPTWDFARRRDGQGVVDATTLDTEAWRSLQTTYRLGELVMPCCDAPAVPKLSPNGLPYFAHVGNGCQTSPESQWHVQAKQLVRDTARDLGFVADLERPGHTGRWRWCADVWIEADGAPFVIELQHSYQHLRDYLGGEAPEGSKALARLLARARTMTKLRQFAR